MTPPHRRVRSASTRVNAVTIRRPEEPASVRWLQVLTTLLLVLEPQGPRPDDATDRVRRSIALPEEYIATSLHLDPWAYREYVCHGCLLRNAGSGRSRVGRPATSPATGGPTWSSAVAPGGGPRVRIVDGARLHAAGPFTTLDAVTATA